MWDYPEKLVIDRAIETIQFTRNISTGCSVTHSCYVQEGVPDLLDRFDADELLEGAPGVPEDLVENPDLKIEFTITLDMKKGSRQTCKGYYDCFDLPEGWAAVMEDIWEFVSFYGFVGDLFDPDTIGTALYDLREKIAEMQKSHLNETIHQTVNNSVE